MRSACCEVCRFLLAPLELFVISHVVIVGVDDELRQRARLASRCAAERRSGFVLFKCHFRFLQLVCLFLGSPTRSPYISRA